MNTKIEKHFQNSQFYRNYNNIENVILHFDKIKNEYTLSKDKYKNRLISLIKILNEKQTRSNFLKKMNIKLIEKYGNKLDDVFKNEFNIDINLSDSCRIILHKMISVSHNIKKYTKYSNNINEDFIKSIVIRNIKNIEILIKNGANIHYKDDYALRWSSKNGYIDLVEYLVENVVDIHTENDCALKLSSYYGHIEVVKFLIGKGADIHSYNDYALRMSSRNGHIEVVKFLVEKGANIHADGDFPVLFSSINGHNEIVKFLVKNGADINIQDNCVLSIFIKYGNIDVVKFLIENGANIHASNDYPIVIASVFERIEIIKILINTDLEYYINSELAKNFIIKHKIVEFYEKFNIVLN